MLHMANLATYGFFALTQMLWGVWLGGRGGGGAGGVVTGGFIALPLLAFPPSNLCRSTCAGQLTNDQGDSGDSANC